MKQTKININDITIKYGSYILSEVYNHIKCFGIDTILILYTNRNMYNHINCLTDLNNLKNKNYDV